MYCLYIPYLEVDQELQLRQNEAMALTGSVAWCCGMVEVLNATVTLTLPPLPSRIALNCAYPT